MSSEKDYRAYLMSKNKQNTNNLNSYKAKYETAIGKITPEEAEQQLELNDNIIDEEQVSNELRDLIRKYVPNVQYLDKALTDSRLTDQMKYDLLLNFGTYVEPRVNAIRNRKLSVERFVAFLVQLGKELQQAGLTQNINENVNKLTNAFRQQINDNENTIINQSVPAMVEDLIQENENTLAMQGITGDLFSTGTKQTKDNIISYIRLMMDIDRLAYHIDKARKISNSSSITILTPESISRIATALKSKTVAQLAEIFADYFERITDESRYVEAGNTAIKKAWDLRILSGRPQPVSAPAPAPLTEEQQMNIKAKLDKDYKPPPAPFDPFNDEVEKIGNEMKTVKLDSSINRQIQKKEKQIQDIEAKIQLAERRIEMIKIEARPLMQNRNNNTITPRDNVILNDLLRQYKKYKNMIDGLKELQNQTIIDIENLENQEKTVSQVRDEYNNQQVRDARLTNYYNDMEQRQPDDTVPYHEYDGRGLVESTIPSKKKTTSSQYEHQLCNGKYFINRKKLSANVLEIRYTKNRHLIPIKSQIVGKSLRYMIEEIIDNNNLDKAKYERLTKLEQNLLRSLLPYLGRDIDDVDDDEAFYDRFDVIRGELLSGNDNKMLKREAKQYLLHAVNTGKISRTHFNQMITDLDL